MSGISGVRDHRSWLGWRLISGLVALLLLAACGAASAPSAPAPAADTNTSATPAAAAPAASSGALASEQVLRAGISRNLVNGEEDWIYAHTNLQVWEPLIRYDDQLKPIPGLAESWTTSDDGKVWTFTLREGVNFSNGDPLTVEDVITSINRFREVSGRPSIFLGRHQLPGDLWRAQGDREDRRAQLQDRVRHAASAADLLDREPL